MSNKITYLRDVPLGKIYLDILVNNVQQYLHGIQKISPMLDYNDMLIIYKENGVNYICDCHKLLVNLNKALKNPDVITVISFDTMMLIGLSTNSSIVVKVNPNFYQGSFRISGYDYEYTCPSFSKDIHKAIIQLKEGLVKSNITALRKYLKEHDLCG